MKVEFLEFHHFRNLKPGIFYPHPGLNFLIGANAQGKTSVLEALALLSSLQSFRPSEPWQFIQHGEPQAQLKCRITDQLERPATFPAPAPWQSDLHLTLKRATDPTGALLERTTKQMAINGKVVRSSAHYLMQRKQMHGGGFHTIIFNPSDHDLVMGAPSERRAYLNRVLVGEEPESIVEFQTYQKILDQRNRLLRDSRISGDSGATGRRLSPEVLEGFSEPLIRYGSKILHRRLEWLQKLAPKLNLSLAKIAPDQAPLKLAYESKILGQSRFFAGQDRVPSLNEIERAFRERLAHLNGAELRSGTTLAGPHREDWFFDQLRGRGSQGEVRSALLALKLAEIDLYRESTGLRPLLLLDDFSSELDRTRRGFLLEFLTQTDLQVFVTTTEVPPVRNREIRTTWVENGILREHNVRPEYTATV